jgi:MoaA/NifB/PqqE/SkfB family radical SAM enzyme
MDVGKLVLTETKGIGVITEDRLDKDKVCLFYVTYQCNLDCVYCTFAKDNLDSNLKTASLDVSEGVKAIIKGGYDWVFITGGEPLLVSNIVDICKAFKNAGLKVGLTTNGTIEYYKVLEVIDRLGVSIDGDEAYTDKARGKGTYQKAVKYLTEATKYPVEIVIMATMPDHNDAQVKHLSELGEQLGIEHLQVTLC